MLGCTVKEAQRRMDSHEFSEWIALDRLEPWGQHRTDYQAALIAWAVYNTFAGEEHSKELEDFLLEWPEAQTPDPELDAQTYEQEKELHLAKIARAMGSVFGGVIDLRTRKKPD